MNKQHIEILNSIACVSELLCKEAANGNPENISGLIKALEVLEKEID